MRPSRRRLYMSSKTYKACLEHIQEGSSQVELIYKPYPSWPLQPEFLASPSYLRISVLDSSFNPPTLAHLALASLKPHDTKEGDYDARLLLLSVRNADKQLEPSDATHIQRMEMMTLLTHDILHANTAVAILDEPTFVGKSAALLSFLRGRLQHPPLSSSPSQTSLPSARIELTFVQGFDTLERLLSPRYYGSAELMSQALRKFLSVDGDNSRVVCARRTMLRKNGADAEKEQRITDSVRGFVEEGRIVLMNIDEDARKMSSTEVRAKISRGDESWRSMVTERIAEYIVAHSLYLTPV
ncbi:hypothetical protein EW146_g4752 [Bondarzewia mesenterica]|uniref:Nicotinamide-nucleotide adenylyltransferase n=1 Tax=Bondarzewia mesenterica TaxID=1095465 RepID=A0A4S4LTL3_9AGAM|nr:hypothetical protein EW146_g4752 [Bondarzewia mesenterica]